MNIPSEVLLNLWIAFFLVSYGAGIAGIRRLLRRDRIARGGK